jgi:hypothetical protein
MKRIEPMNIHEYAEFLGKLEKRVVWSDGVPFCGHRKGLLWSIPQFVSYDLEPERFHRLVWRKSLGVFYCSERHGMENGGLWVLWGPDYGLQRLNAKRRNLVRRGLERCEIRRLDWDLLKREGLLMNRETLKRQGRRSGMIDDRSWWARQCDVSARYKDVLAYGAFIEGRIASYLYLIIHDEVSREGRGRRVGNIIHAGSYSKYLKEKSYPNEALMYTVVKELIEEERCDRVVNGFRGDNPTLASWKRHMGFVEEPYFVKLIANPILLALSPFIPKLKGFLKR